MVCEWAMQDWLNRFLGVNDISRMYRVVIVSSCSESEIVSKKSRIAPTEVPRSYFLPSPTNYYERANCSLDRSTGFDLLHAPIDLGSFLFQRVLKAGGDSRFTEIKKEVLPTIQLDTTDVSLHCSSGSGSDRRRGFQSSLSQSLPWILSRRLCIHHWTGKISSEWPFGLVDSWLKSSRIVKRVSGERTKRRRNTMKTGFPVACGAKVGIQTISVSIPWQFLPISLTTSRFVLCDSYSRGEYDLDRCVCCFSACSQHDAIVSFLVWISHRYLTYIHLPYSYKS